MRINEEIQAPKVRVIDNEGKQLGVFLIKDARRLASDKAKDLVEIAPQAKPPVCKIIDYGKFRYEIQKKEKIQKKNQQVSVLKEIRFHPNTDVHDFDFKTRHAINFLEEGNKVKATVVFKGREMAYAEQGENLLRRFLDRVQDVAKVEVEPKMEGRNMSLIVVPNIKKGKKKQQ
ncbi:MAG: translation initiation factor IF-3 [Ignavibacteriaceae bacterium]|nr:translation initiation factor IF-3 [Ignavibacteriaceae bacterium]MCW9066432.1 translation initiation factor IF-3 [Ignavibacteriaceae bacterium]